MFRVRKPMSNDTVWGTITLFLVFFFYQHSIDAIVKNIEVILTDVCILHWNLLVCAVTDITSTLILHSIFYKLSFLGIMFLLVAKHERDTSIYLH